MSTHTSHPDIIKRLKRANGHLNSVITMLEEDHPCLDITQQLESALSNKKLLIHDHIDHCLEHALDDSTRTADDIIKEFKAITKYL